MAFENIKNPTYISAEENAEIKFLIKQISEKFNVPISELVVKLKPYLEFSKVWMNPKIYSDSNTTAFAFKVVLTKMLQNENYIDVDFGDFYSNFNTDSLNRLDRYLKQQNDFRNKLMSLDEKTFNDVLVFLRKEMEKTTKLRIEMSSKSGTRLIYEVDKFVEKRKIAETKKANKSNVQYLVIDIDEILTLSEIIEKINITKQDVINYFFTKRETAKRNFKATDLEIDENISLLYYYCLIYQKLTFESFPINYFERYVTYFDFTANEIKESIKEMLVLLNKFINIAQDESIKNNIALSKYYSPVAKMMFGSTDNLYGMMFDVNVKNLLPKIITHINSKFSKENTALIKNQIATATETSTNSTVEIKGKPHFTFNQIIPFYRDYFNYICEFLNLNNIKLILNFKNTGSYGGYVKNAEFTESEYIFHINNTDKHNIFDVLEFIPHELVHVEQYHSKRMYDEKNGNVIFENVRYGRVNNNTRNLRGYLNYISQPWEREAHLKSFEIMNTYFTSERFKSLIENNEIKENISAGVNKVISKVNAKKQEYFSSFKD